MSDLDDLANVRSLKRAKPPRRRGSWRWVTVGAICVTLVGHYYLYDWYLKAKNGQHDEQESTSTTDDPTKHAPIERTELPEKHTEPPVPPPVIREPSKVTRTVSLPPATVVARPPAPRRVRRSVPATADLAKSRSQMAELFKNQLADQSTEGRLKLAAMLLAEVPKTSDNPVDQYVLLRGAINAAKAAGDLRLCFQATEQMAGMFDVDALAIKLDAVNGAPLKRETVVDTARNGRAALELVAELVDVDDLKAADDVCSLLKPIVVENVELSSSVDARIREIANLLVEKEVFLKASDVLKAAPKDPAANLVVGRYYCLVRDEWNHGLTNLTNGSDADLQLAAANEMAGTKSTEDVGNGWWKASENRAEPDRGKLRQHAATFYRAALPDSKGLTTQLLEKRLAGLPAAGAAAGVALGNPVFTNALGMQMVTLPAGKFMMGSPPNEKGRAEYEVPHQVALRRAFSISAYPMTREQFGRFIMESGYKTTSEKQGFSNAWNVKENRWQRRDGASWKQEDGFPQTDSHPVINVSWHDAVALCEWLSRKELKTCRLPTEAEFEYACRAGTATAYFWGDDPDAGQGYANAADLTLQGIYPDLTNVFQWKDGIVITSPVGSFKPNPWGLYDIIGNTMEWCLDVYAEYPIESVSYDPSGPPPTMNIQRVLRGGSWGSAPEYCRCAFRKGESPDFRTNYIGFRIVMETR